MRMHTIGIGLFGSNGHQLDAHQPLVGAHVVATCAVPNAPPHVRQYAEIADLLADPEVALVAVCAPRRDAQAAVIRQALMAGKHVYAEKPCVMTHDDLVELTALAAERGCELFDMGGTADEAPYAAIAPVIAAGQMGVVGQVVVRKSYPYADWRPQDEGIDGGLIMQSGIHAVRLIEHLLATPIVRISAIATRIGNPQRDGELRMAVNMQAHLHSGAVASVVANYYHRHGQAMWGDDEVRVYGSDGYVVAGSSGEAVLVKDGLRMPVVCEPQPPYIQRVIDVLRGQALRPRLMVHDLHATHVVIAARASAEQAGAWMHVP
jgi:predicted dehydrogenase